MAYSQHQLNIANRVNMYDFMTNQGAHWVKFSAKEDYLAEHDSMKANRKTGVVTWYSKGSLSSFNNAIEFAQKVYPEIPHDDLVSQLLDQGIQEMNHEKTTMKTPAEKQASFSLQAIQKNARVIVKDTGALTAQGRAYLTKKRFIDPQTVKLFENHHLITSDNMGNVLFHWRREGKTIGVDQQGIRKRSLKSRVHQQPNHTITLDRAYYKGIGKYSASDGGFEFNALQATDRLLSNPKEPINLYVCEAPIETMSLLELNLRKGEYEKTTDNAHYLSMSGLKQNAVYREINALEKQYGRDRPLNIIMATNGDEPGQKFVKKIVHEYRHSDAVNANVHWQWLQPNLEKADWNEMLEYQKTGKLQSRIEKKHDLSQAQRLFRNLSNTQEAHMSSTPALSQQLGAGA